MKSILEFVYTSIVLTFFAIILLIPILNVFIFVQLIDNLKGDDYS